MDEKLFELGLEKRHATLGKEYVDKNLSKADDFSLSFQQADTMVLGVWLGRCNH